MDIIRAPMAGRARMRHPVRVLVGWLINAGGAVVLLASIFGSDV
nr:hypothetical protein [Cupriavidus gilardii]